MTEQELTALDALAQEAAPGPWEAEDTYGGYAYIAKLQVSRDDGDMPVADARFIAAARTAVPALVAEVRRLQQDAARWAFIRDSGQLAVKQMRLLSGEDISGGYVGGVYADMAVDTMIAKEERRRALDGAP